MTALQAAWSAIHDALPAGWTVGPGIITPIRLAAKLAAVTIESSHPSRLARRGRADNFAAALPAFERFLRSVGG